MDDVMDTIYRGIRWFLDKIVGNIAALGLLARDVVCNFGDRSPVLVRRRLRMGPGFRDLCDHRFCILLLCCDAS